MYALDKNKLHWERILIIMMFMAALSYTMGKIPNGDKLIQQVNEYSNRCPFYFETGFRVDSIILVAPKKIHMYCYYENEVFLNMDTTIFENTLKSIYQTKYSNKNTSSFLRNGYSIHIVIMAKDSVEYILKIDANTLLN